MAGRGVSDNGRFLSASGRPSFLSLRRCIKDVAHRRQFERDYGQIAAFAWTCSPLTLQSRQEVAMFHCDGASGRPFEGPDALKESMP